MLAAPTPTISRFPSISAPVLSANTDAVEMVSVRETREMPSAPAKSRARSPSGTVGMVNGGNPDGSAPTRATPRSSRSNTATAAIARRTAARMLGKIGHRRWRTRISARQATPTASAAPTVSPSWTASANATASSIRPSASTENPNSLGSWLTRMVSARPFMYPIWVGFESRSATKPSLNTPASTVIAPTMSASTEA